MLVRAYDISATPPGETGFQSVISQVVTAVMGRGPFYYATMTAVLMVLGDVGKHQLRGFSARMPRAGGRPLPATRVGQRGSRLVFTNGIIVLATLDHTFQ